MSRNRPGLNTREALAYEAVRWSCIAGIALVAAHNSSGLRGSSACVAGEAYPDGQYPVTTRFGTIEAPVCLHGVWTINMTMKGNEHGTD